MTPKQKAEELMNKMLGLELEDLTKFDYIDHEAAKHFSLIAVDEIIEVTKMHQFALVTNKKSIPAKIVKNPFWVKVRNEIENL